MQNPNGLKRIDKEEKFLSKFSNLMSLKNVRNDPNAPQEDQNVVINKSQKEDRVVKFKNAITTDEERNQWISLTQEMGGKYDQLVGTIKKTKTKIKQNGVDQVDLDERVSKYVSKIEEEQKFILQKSQGFFEYAPHFDKVNHNKRQQIREKFLDTKLDQYYVCDPIKNFLKNNNKINHKLQLRSNLARDGLEHHTTHKQFHNNLHPNSIIVEQNVGRYLINLAVQLKLDLIEDFDDDYVTINGAKCSYQQVPKQLMTMINQYEDIFKLQFFKEADLKNINNQELKVLTKQQKEIIQAARRDLRKIEKQFQEKKNIKIDDINTSSNTEQEVQYFKEMIPKKNLSHHDKLQIIHNVLQSYNNKKVRLAVPQLEIIKNENQIESKEDDLQFLTDNTYSEVSLRKLDDSLSDESVTYQSNHSDAQDFILDQFYGKNGKRKIFTIKPEYYKKQILEQNQINKSKKKSKKERVHNKLNISLHLDEEKMSIQRKKNLLVKRDVNLTETELQFQDKNQEIPSSDYDSSQQSEQSDIIIQKELFEIPKQAWNLDNIGIFNELKKRGEEIPEEVEAPEVQELSNSEIEKLVRAQLDEAKNKKLDEVMRDLNNKEQNELIDFNINKQLFSGELRRQIERQFEQPPQHQEQLESNAEQNLQKKSDPDKNGAKQTDEIEYFNQFRIPGTNHIEFAKMKNSQIRHYYDILKKSTNPFADGTEFMQIFKFKDLDIEKVDQSGKARKIYDSDEDLKVLDKIEKINKKFKYHRQILENGLYQGIDLYKMQGMDRNGRIKNKKRIGANKEQEENSQSYHSLQQDSQRSNRDKKGNQQSQGPQSQQSQNRPLTQRACPLYKIQKRQKIKQRLQTIIDQNSEINLLQFHKEFAKKAERYNELDIDHEEHINAPVQTLNYVEFLQSLQRFEINNGNDKTSVENKKVIKGNQKPEEEERQSLLKNEKCKKVQGMAKDTKIKRNFKQTEKDNQSDQEDRNDEYQENNYDNEQVLFDDSQGEEIENFIRNFDLDYPRQQIVRPDDFLSPLISVINLKYPTDALNKILSEEDLQFVKPFLKPKIYKSRINERIYDINVNPIANIKTSQLFEAFQFFKQPKIQEQIYSKNLNELHDQNESFQSVGSVDQKGQNIQDQDDDSEIDEGLLIKQQLEKELEQKSEIKDFYKIEDQIDPNIVSVQQEFDQDFEEESRQVPNFYEMEVEQPISQQIKQSNRRFNYEQENQEEFTHGNITMGSYQSENPIMKILQQATGSKQDEDEYLYDSSYQSQEQEQQSNRDKKDKPKPKPNTLSSKLGFDRKNQVIVVQPPISFDSNEILSRDIFEINKQQAKVEEDTGFDNIEQKFLKNPDQEDDYKVNLFQGYFSVELNQINIDRLNREIILGENKQIELNEISFEEADQEEYEQLSLVQMIERHFSEKEAFKQAGQQKQGQNEQYQDQFSQSQLIEESFNQPIKHEKFDQLNRSLYNQDDDQEELITYDKRLQNLSAFIDINSSSEKKPQKNKYQKQQQKQESEKKELYQLYEDQEVLNVEDVEIAKLLLQEDLLRKDEAEMAINNKKFAENCDKFCKQLCARQGFNIHDALEFAARDNVHLQVQDYLRYDILYRPIMSVYNKYKQPDMIQLIQIIFEYLRDNISYEDQGPGILFSFVDKHVQEWYFEEDRATNDITQVPYAQVFRALVHIANKINLKLVQKKEDEETDFLIYLGKGQKRLDEIDFFITKDDDI